MRNTRPRTDWDDLPDGVRDAMASETGFASLGGDAGMVTGQTRDQPARRPVAARLLWQINHDGWNVLGFEHLHGRHGSTRVRRALADRRSPHTCGR
jgi:hypothetical protein